MRESWSLKGELALSCSCTVFCPCVLSLGDHPPTESRCQTWAGIRIDDGHFDSEDLSGMKVGLMMDLPGIMSRGNWTAALFVDDKASALGGQGADPHLHRPRRRHHASAVDPGRPISRRAAGADRLRDPGRDPHHQHREICRRRDHAGARQGAGPERGDPQQRILDRPRRHRLARRQVALPRLRPQLELDGPLGRNRASSTGAISSRS